MGVEPITRLTVSSCRSADDLDGSGIAFVVRGCEFGGNSCQQRKHLSRLRAGTQLTKSEARQSRAGSTFGRSPQTRAGRTACARSASRAGFCRGSWRSASFSAPHQASRGRPGQSRLTTSGPPAALPGEETASGAVAVILRRPLLLLLPAASVCDDADAGRSS